MSKKTLKFYNIRNNKKEFQREFDGVIKANFWGNDMPKENMHYTSIAGMTIDSLLRIDKKIHPQIDLEECKDRLKNANVKIYKH